jgi:hypothetical protein
MRRPDYSVALYPYPPFGLMKVDNPIPNGVRSAKLARVNVHKGRCVAARHNPAAVASG